jgi:hypothetical protein
MLIIVQKLVFIKPRNGERKIKIIINTDCTDLSARLAMNKIYRAYVQMEMDLVSINIALNRMLK